MSLQDLRKVFRNLLGLEAARASVYNLRFRKLNMAEKKLPTQQRAGIALNPKLMTPPAQAPSSLTWILQSLLHSWDRLQCPFLPRKQRCPGSCRFRIEGFTAPKLHVCCLLRMRKHGQHDQPVSATVPGHRRVWPELLRSTGKQSNTGFRN